MPSLKEVQTKIQSVKKTKQITKAMNMVATSRLRGAQVAMDGFRIYADKFAEVLSSLVEKAGDETSSPLLLEKEEVRKINLIFCTSDRGLCGGFNFGLFKKVDNFLKEKKSDDLEVSFINFGKKGFDWVNKKGLKVDFKYIGLMGKELSFSVAHNTGKWLVDSFVGGKLDEVYIVYSQFISVAKQIPVIKKILPIPSIGNELEDVDVSYQSEHICEPSPKVLLGNILPQSVYVQLYIALLESSTSEHAARMTAMDNATKACNDMVDSLTLAYNKARQAAITADLMDIIGGAEALKG